MHVHGFTRFAVLLAAFCCELGGSATSFAQRDYTRFVDPFIGSGGVGHTFPGATYPLGLIQLSPDTGTGAWAYCSGYQFSDESVDGFSHTHLSGGGGADLGDVLMLPFSLDSTLTAKKAGVDKSQEQASPGYYATLLDDDGIRVELTVSPRTGMHRYTYSKKPKRLLIRIDRILWSYGSGRTYDATLDVESERRISGGYGCHGRAERQVYFAIEFDQPIAKHSYLDPPARKQLLLHFADHGSDTILARVALSTVSVEGAWKNLQAESSGRSFERLRQLAVKR